jgi:DNA-binding NtrC family response regulator
MNEDDAKSGGSILVVDDDRNIRTLFRHSLTKAGFTVVEAEDYKEAYPLLENAEQFDVILLDVMLPEVSGIDILQHIQGLPESPPVVMVTASGVVQDAVTALKLGAFDYLIKPDDTNNLPKFLGVLTNAVNFTRSRREIDRLSRELADRWDSRNMVGESVGMRRVSTMISQVSQSDVTVLIQGDSGTGKELVAKAVHYNSDRSKGPFIPINCAAIPETLIESELFGHEKGAFTGAVAQKKGKFDLARGGTIFLDEIGDMIPSAQTRLLRVLENKTFERVGGTEALETNVRIIAATNKDLQDEVEQEKFRLDLYYRLSVFPIELPPLKNRPEDIALLAAHFLHEYAEQTSKDITGFEPQVLNAFAQHAWPGNVRELQNVIHRAVIVADGNVIKLSDLPTELNALGMAQIHLGRNAVLIEDPETNDIRALEDVERDVIKRALEVTGGNFTVAAQKLGIGRATLYRKVKEYELEIEE